MAPSATATRPTAEATLTMRPRPRSTMPGATALVPLIRPCTLTSMIARVTDVGLLEHRPERHDAGVVDQDVDRPDLAHLGEEALPRLGAGDVEAGADGAATDPLRDLLAPATSSRSPSATVAPCEASSSAVASPIPRAAPVITTVSPEMSRLLMEWGPFEAAQGDRLAVRGERE